MFLRADNYYLFQSMEIGFVPFLFEPIQGEAGVHIYRAISSLPLSLVILNF
jgi:hypothetical protein